MSQGHLDRVREDLQTIRSAAGLELPFGRFDMFSNVWVGICGLFVTLCAMAVPWEYRGFVAVPLCLAVAGGAWAGMLARRDRAARPASWREHKLGIAGALIVTPVVVAYMRWERHLGMPREMVGAAAMFFVGVGLLLFAFVDRRRLYYVGGGLALMVAGTAVPTLAPSQVIAVGGLCIAVGCFSAAAVQFWQLRRSATHDSTH